MKQLSPLPKIIQQKKPPLPHGSKGGIFFLVFICSPELCFCGSCAARAFRVFSFGKRND